MVRRILVAIFLLALAVPGCGSGIALAYAGHPIGGAVVALLAIACGTLLARFINSVAKR